MQRKRFLDFRSPIVISGVHVQYPATQFVELNSPEETVELSAPTMKCHSGRNCLVLNKRYLHRSPGHQTDGGLSAEILVIRKATR